uniref:OSJNBb0008G24.15 protein n=1 Tax=Oryza sativa subsp. japonica TaxID=39947 RepID=Q7F2J5_ORYSJ|nr:OSJNBb0008G24.15 [Oryza sativa Japonica Group]
MVPGHHGFKCTKLLKFFKIFKLVILKTTSTITIKILSDFGLGKASVRHSDLDLRFTAIGYHVSILRTGTIFFNSAASEDHQF